MQKRPEGWNIVLAGFWNRMIFTPEWVGPRLFSDNQQLETLVSFLPGRPIIYRDDQVAIEISGSRLVCRARDLENEQALRHTGNMAATILHELPETPVQGLGVNFAFTEHVPSGDLLELFNFNDNARLAENEWGIDERQIVRRLSHDRDTLNFTLTFNNEELDIACNFHTVPDDSNSAVAAAEPERVLRLRDTAIRMLEDLYGLQMEEDSGDF